MVEKRFIVLFGDTAQHHMLHINTIYKIIQILDFPLHDTFSRLI